MAHESAPASTPVPTTRGSSAGSDRERRRPGHGCPRPGRRLDCSASVAPSPASLFSPASSCVPSPGRPLQPFCNPKARSAMGLVGTLWAAGRCLSLHMATVFVTPCGGSVLFGSRWSGYSACLIRKSSVVRIHVHPPAICSEIAIRVPRSSGRAHPRPTQGHAACATELTGPTHPKAAPSCEDIAGQACAFARLRRSPGHREHRPRRPCAQRLRVYDRHRGQAGSPWHSRPGDGGTHGDFATRR